MPDYRCNRVPDGTFFFTVNPRDRRSHLLVAQIDRVHDAVRRARAHPFASTPHRPGVVLPDHMHRQRILAGGPCRKPMPTSPVGGAQSKSHL
jgi:REP element-mobilizing transposase RayT